MKKHLFMTLLKIIFGHVKEYTLIITIFFYFNLVKFIIKYDYIFYCSIERSSSYPMLFQFITSPQFVKSTTTNNAPPKSVRAQELLQQIKKIITSLPSLDICKQAAINSCLPLTLTNFQQVQTKAESQTQANILNYTLMQLKTLQRQAKKLKDLGNRSIIINKKIPVGYKELHSQKISIRRNSEDDSSQKEQDFDKEMMSALKNQMAFRVKLQKFYSTEKIQKKEELIKKKAERVRDMNKRAMKVYKIFKQKEEVHPQTIKIDNFFSTPPQEKQVLQLIPPDICKTQAKDQEIITSNCQPIVFAAPTQKQIRSVKCKTLTGKRLISTAKLPFREVAWNTSNTFSQQRFTQFNQRSIQTRQRKRRIQQQRQSNAIKRVIKKQQKINNIDHKKNGKKQNKIQKEQHKINKPKEDSSLQNKIKSKCEETMFKKYIQLQQRVNKIRGELKTKEERMQKFRQRKEKQHDQSIERNQICIRNYNSKIKENKQERQFRHEQAIRNRFENVQQKQKYWKMVENFSKMTDEQLKKQMDKLKQKQFFSTLKSIMFLHIN